MSRLNDLIRQVGLSNPSLAADLQREVGALADRRSFGLNFERHVPEAVELPGRPVRKGDKVRVLPARGERRTRDNERLWRVIGANATSRQAQLLSIPDESETIEVSFEDLIVVAEFRDPIYPGLVSTGQVQRGDDRPFHAVINGENFHALQALLFTHRGKVDCIYIDPPYNTGAKDWKYNNDYVESDDQYRHSKWLAFMERRLAVAKELLRPEDSFLIVTIDEKEYLRLGLLLEQTFPEARMQMVSIVIKPEGTNRVGEFSRTNEFAYFLMFGTARVVATSDDMTGRRDVTTGEKPIEWRNLRRRENTSVRSARPNQFYAVFVDESTGAIRDVGDPLPSHIDRSTVTAPEGCVACFPLKPDGTEMLWGLTPGALRRLWEKGYARVVPAKGDGNWVVQYLAGGTVEAIESGAVHLDGRDEQGAVIGRFKNATVMPKTTWSKEAHNAQTGGTLLFNALLPDRRFPFPKSLYAVEDALRFAVKDKPAAVILDFFAGSGTTAHAVMRLNRQDGGRRQCLLVTNNEVSPEEQEALRIRGLRAGDPQWEEQGICEFITKPRVRAAITGTTPSGEPIKAEYRFTDEFPMASGFAENVEFFTLTYEMPLRVASHRSFDRISPLLWLRAGARGRRVDDLSKGWGVAEAYGVLSDLDCVEEFLGALHKEESAELAFILTDEDRLFEAVAQRLPDGIEPVKLYESYLRNFEIEAGRGYR